MKKVVLVAVLLLGCCLMAMAEDAPKMEVFGGYSFFRCNPDNAKGSCDLHGWMGSAAINATNWLAGVGEFGGNYGSLDDADNVNTLSFLFGPRFFIRRNEKVTPFVHALVGDTWLHAKAGKTTIREEHDFTLAFGGGLNLKVSKNFSLRPFQADYLILRPKNSTTMHNFRFATGFVFTFGELGS
jgi:opacity protein-like surface antigen